MIQEKFQVTWQPSLKPTLQTCGFLSFEKSEACQAILNPNYVEWENSPKLTWSKKDRLCVKLSFTLRI